jgi:hypothetical protein
MQLVIRNLSKTDRHSTRAVNGVSLDRPAGSEACR